MLDYHHILFYFRVTGAVSDHALVSDAFSDTFVDVKC